jgi:hypothetical protein
MALHPDEYNAASTLLFLENQSVLYYKDWDATPYLHLYVASQIKWRLEHICSYSRPDSFLVQMLRRMQTACEDYQEAIYRNSVPGFDMLETHVDDGVMQGLAAEFRRAISAPLTELIDRYSLVVHNKYLGLLTLEEKKTC